MSEASDTSEVLTTAITEQVGKERYRYVLKRVWDVNKPVNAFICANPSMADHLRFDLTVCNCINLAVAWGWGGLYVLNAYPHYATDDDDLLTDSTTDATNAVHIALVCASVSRLVLATGAKHQGRLAELISDVPKTKLFCLKNNKIGYRHPSRIRISDYPCPVPCA
jgi:hypothetical protein